MEQLGKIKILCFYDEPIEFYCWSTKDNQLYLCQRTAGDQPEYATVPITEQQAVTLENNSADVDTVIENSSVKYKTIVLSDKLMLLR
nr:MAG TPA: hypothetical protein [Caudoviricetes sp.]